MLHHITAILVAIACAWNLPERSAQGQERPSLPRLLPFALSEVRLSDGRLKAARDKNREYLLSLDPDRLLHAFRVNAGLPSTAQPLGGWEKPDCEVRGHFVGHYLSACALLYEATGDEAVKTRGDRIVAELGRCQQALGGEYLSAFPASFFDRLEAGQPAWAPYYTIHKIMAGLHDMHAHAGNREALDIAGRMAVYFRKRCERFTAGQLREQLDKNEEGGMCEILWNLYAVTKDPAAREAADKLERRTFLDPLARGEDNLARRHGNTHIPLAVGAVRRYEITGEERYLYAARYFWDRVVLTRSFATGGTTDAEIWGEPYKLAHTLSNTNHETCKTYNMLRLTRQLFSHTSDCRYADFYERAFLNGILGTQEPTSGMLEYYVPMAPGHKRVYGTPTDAFWCCYGTGVETFAKLGDSVWFHDADNLYVNLYTASSVSWSAKGVDIEQVTRYPDEDTVRLLVHAKQPTKLTLHLRIPEWPQRPATLTLDGRSLDVPLKPGRFAAIDREWRDGDRLVLTLPMDLHVAPMPDDPNLVAILHGPLVLAGLVDEHEPDRPICSANPAETIPQVETIPRAYFVADSPTDVSWLKPVEGRSHCFRATGQPFATMFVPFHQIIGRRYAIYFPVIPKGSDRVRQMELLNQAVALLKRAAEIPDAPTFARVSDEFNRVLAEPLLTGHRDRLAPVIARYNPLLKLEGPEVIDRVWPGDSKSESEHNLQQQNSPVGTHMGRGWRHATSGNWWSWDLKVRADAPVGLRCIYWGDDVPPRTFDILVNGHKVATQALDHDRPGQFFVVDCQIPRELTQGKDMVNVRFRPHEGAIAGGVFGCATLTRQ